MPPPPMGRRDAATAAFSPLSRFAQDDCRFAADEAADGTHCDALFLIMPADI